MTMTWYAVVFVANAFAAAHGIANDYKWMYALNAVCAGAGLAWFVEAVIKRTKE